MITHIPELSFLCVLALAGFSAYASGRVHQRRREDFQRKAAFLDGFQRACVTADLVMAGGDLPALRGRLLRQVTDRPSNDPGAPQAKLPSARQAGER